MDNFFIFPWGPLLLKQTIEPLDLKYYLDGLNNTSNVKMDSYFGEVDRQVYNNDSNFKKLLFPYIKNYLRIEESKVEGFYVSDLWINIYNNRTFVPPHTHSKCDLSFVFFLKTPPIEKLKNINEGSLCFSYGNEQHTYIKTIKISKHSISPKIGELYIFPSNLEHYTIPISNPKLERISVSGNIIFK